MPWEQSTGRGTRRSCGILWDPNTGFSSLLGPEQEREEFRTGLSFFFFFYKTLVSASAARPPGTVTRARYGAAGRRVSVGHCASSSARSSHGPRRRPRHRAHFAAEACPLWAQIHEPWPGSSGRQATEWDSTPPRPDSSPSTSRLRSTCPN